MKLGMKGPVTLTRQLGHVPVEKKQALAHSSQKECPHSLNTTADSSTSWQTAQSKRAGGCDVKISTAYPMFAKKCV